MEKVSLRIGFYTDTALPKLGGQEIVVDELARQFVEMGHKVNVLAPWPRAPMRTNDREFPYAVARHPRFYSTRRMVWAYRWFLLRWAKENQFDVLHCHGLYPCGYLATLCRDRLKLPIVMTSHGGDVYEQSSRLRDPLLRSRYELAARSADRLISISDFTRRGLLRMGADENRIVNIPNGVNFREFSTSTPRPAQIPDDLLPGKYFLFIGRLVARKGVDTLLRATAQITSMPSDIRLAIAGGGDERDALQSLCRQLGLEHRVHFLGPVRGALKNYLFQNSICAIVPSHQWEAFGLVVVESYAAGRPVITTRHPGLADLVNEGITGFVVDPESVPQLAQAMQKMIDNPVATNQMGENAQSKARTFDWTDVAAQHIEAYKGLLNGHGAL
ncbi:MAG TPA: glycosyltransferase family 4 protein [Tepidisphaeraceae bacterium]|nr:glycosyltransferase family 4 protein [Tepidisphaeraceae bacterium]